MSSDSIRWSAFFCFGSVTAHHVDSRSDVIDTVNDRARQAALVLRALLRR